MAIRLRVVSLLVALTLLGACHASKNTLKPERIDVAGMENAVAFGDLTIGGQPTEESLEALANKGYRTVVTVRSPAEMDWDEEAAVKALGMSFRRIQIGNPVNEITDEQVDEFAQFMDWRQGPALLHCGSGNRAAGLWAAWLISYQGLKPDEAIRLAMEAGMRESMKAVVERRVSQNSSR